MKMQEVVPVSEQDRVPAAAFGSRMTQKGFCSPHWEWGKSGVKGGTGAQPKDFCVSLMWSVSALCIGVSGTVLMTVSDRRHYSDPLARGFVSVPRTVGPVKRCHRLNGRCPASKPGACEQTVSQPEWTRLSSGNLRAAQGGCDESVVHVILGIVDPKTDRNYNLRWMRL